MGLPPVAVGWLVCFKMYSRVKHQWRQRKSRTSFRARTYRAAERGSARAKLLRSAASAADFTCSRKSRWLPGR